MFNVRFNQQPTQNRPLLPPGNRHAFFPSVLSQEQRGKKAKQKQISPFPSSTLSMASAAARTQFQQSVSPAALRSYASEFLSTFLYVLAAVGSSMSALKLETTEYYVPSLLVASALAQGTAIFAAMYIASDISGGHANPAITFAHAICGHVDAFTVLFYWTAQLLASTLSCLLLRLATAGHPVPTTGIAPEMTGFGAAVLEATVTFTLVYTVLVSCGSGRQKGPPGMAPGVVTTACVLAVGGFTGGSMNPARSFGPAIVSGDFRNQAVYWVGPMIGAAIASLVHQNLVAVDGGAPQCPPPGSPRAGMTADVGI